MRALLIFCSLFFLNVHHVIAQDAEELVKKVKAKLDKVNDYQAEGKMKLDVSFIGAPESKVTMYYKKPNKFKVKKDGGISIFPKGGINVNVGNLLDKTDYDIVAGKDAVVNGVNTKVVKLLSSDESTDVTILYIEEKNLVIRKAIVSQGSSKYEIEMSYGKFIDWGLPDKVVFTFNTTDFKLPKGITFEYEKGGKKKEGDAVKNKKGKIELSYSSYTINKGVDDKVFEKT